MPMSPRKVFLVKNARDPLEIGVHFHSLPGSLLGAGVRAWATGGMEIKVV